MRKYKVENSCPGPLPRCLRVALHQRNFGVKRCSNIDSTFFSRTLSDSLLLGGQSAGLDFLPWLSSSTTFCEKTQTHTSWAQPYSQECLQLAAIVQTRNTSDIRELVHKSPHSICPSPPLLSIFNKHAAGLVHMCACVRVTQHESGASSVLMVIRHRQRLI